VRAGVCVCVCVCVCVFGISLCMKDVAFLQVYAKQIDRQFMLMEVLII